jgi:hypothetical protein
MTRRGTAALLVFTLAAAACASIERPAARATTPGAAAPTVDWAARLAEADSLYLAGHYTALRDAQRTYGEALAAVGRRPGVAERYIRTTIALDLRRKELGILPAPPPVDPVALAAADPTLSRYGPWLELVAGLPNKIKGVPGIDQTGGRTLDEQLGWIANRVPDLDRDLDRAAAADDLAAALRLALRLFLSSSRTSSSRKP